MNGQTCCHFAVQEGEVQAKKVCEGAGEDKGVSSLPADVPLLHDVQEPHEGTQ